MSDSNTQLGPSKLTPQLVQTFTKVLSMGNYPIVACQVVGIHISTYRSWMRTGEDHNELGKDSMYRTFYLTVGEANAAAEAYALNKWHGHMGTNYKAARDFLARRFSSRWGPTYKITIEVEKELTRLMEKLAEKLDPETYQKVIVALADAQEDLTDDPDDEDAYINMATITNMESPND